MNVENFQAPSELSLFRPFQGSTHPGEGRVQENSYVHARNAAITGRQRLGKAIHVTRIGKACPAQIANHIPD